MRRHKPVRPVAEVFASLPRFSILLGMVDLSTYAKVEAELAETAGYDVNDSVAEARRRVAALRRKLDYAERSDEEGNMVQFNHQVVLDQLNRAVAFVRDSEQQSAQNRLNNPRVTHADFSTTGQYRGGGGY